MKLNLWGGVSYKTSSVVSSLGDGINTFFPPIDIKESEWSYGMNCSSRNYPALSVRPGRQYSFSQITTPWILGQRNNQYPHVQDGTVWKRWDGSAWQNVQTGLTGATGKFVDFKTGTSLYTILANGTNKYSWDGSSTTNLTNMPATKLVTVHKGRVYALNGKTLYFSALNLINDWTTVDDAGQIDLTRAKGDGSALTAYGNHVIAFTEFSMHELYGTGPDSYTLSDVEGAKGCISDKSVVELNGALYWAYYDGIYAYTGGVPVKISDKANYWFGLLNTAQKANIAAGAIGYSIYFAMPYNGSTNNNLILEYDTRHGNWYPHSGSIMQFVTIGNKLYGLGYDGHIWDMENGTTDAGTAIPWEVIGKVSNDGAISQKKVVSNIWLSVDLPVGSTLSVYTSPSFDNNDFTLLSTVTPGANEQNHRAIIPVTMLQNVDWYRIKFAGTGPCTIHFMEKIIRIKKR